MDFFSWLKLVCTGSVLSALISVFASGKKFGSYIGFSCFAAIICIIFFPAAEAIKKLPESIKFNSSVINESAYEYTVSGSEYIEKQTKEYLAKNIRTLICEKTGTDAFKAEMQFNFSEKEILNSTKIDIIPQNSTVYTVFEIKRGMLENFLESVLMCEVSINIV